jgi:predicted metallopeptidase
VRGTYRILRPDLCFGAPSVKPFDFSARIAALCADIARRCPELRHVRTEQIHFGITRARSPGRYGLQAKITPMRFQNGSLTRRRRGRLYQVQQYWINGVEMLYLMTFCLPRFLKQSFEEKFITIFHELYHISPNFDGDLRRHEGRYCVHTHSQKKYDSHMDLLAKSYLASRPDPALFQFLRLEIEHLLREHGALVGSSLPMPRLVPILLV